jgi:hypothetical protein
MHLELGFVPKSASSASKRAFSCCAASRGSTCSASTWYFLRKHLVFSAGAWSFSASTWSFSASTWSFSANTWSFFRKHLVFFGQHLVFLPQAAAYFFSTSSIMSSRIRSWI